MEREKLSSRLGFILLSAGCAIGCGNVWKFPWMTGQNGGGGFVLIYILFLLVLGLPVMTMEFAMGRAAQASPVRMYHKLEKPGTKWHIHGYVSFFANICLMAFYTVVTGWMIYYFFKFLIGQNQNLGFEAMITDPKINVIFLAITVFIGFGTLCFKLQGGLERVTKYMMIVMLFLMAVLAVHSATLSGAAEGYKFYLVPDFAKITPTVVVSAMNQAFFTLSIGIGSMAIFGSYIGKERSLLGESVNVIVLDTFVAIVSGLIIFPACYTYNLEVTAGPKGCLICGIVIFLLALTTALGYSVLHFQPFAKGTAWLDFWDFLVSTNFLPLGSLVVALFCCNKQLGWGWDNLVAEANIGKGMKVKNWMKPIFMYFVPAAIMVIYIVGLVNFQWR